MKKKVKNGKNKSRRKNKIVIKIDKLNKQFNKQQIQMSKKIHI
jgi:hypothetical protein